MPSTHYLTRSTLFALVLSLPVLGWAEDMPCSKLIEEAQGWNKNTPVYRVTLFKAMSDDVKERLAEADTHREVPRGTVKNIESIQLDLFLKECTDNPSLGTHLASERALEKTREAAIDYLEHRNE